MKLIKKIYHKLFKRRLDFEHIDAQKEDLRFSKIQLELRNSAKRKFISVGKNCRVNGHFVFESDRGFVKIGNRCSMGGELFICMDKIEIDDNVQIAWNFLIYDHNAHSMDFRERRKDIDVLIQNQKLGEDVVYKLQGKDWSVVHSAPIHICHDAWIGTNVTILNGVTIGEGAIIGAGSVVREDIPAWSIAYGNPCKVVAMNKYKPNEDKL